MYVGIFARPRITFIRAPKGMYCGNPKVKRNATIRLSFQSDKYLRIVLDALRPETRKSPSARSRTRVEEEEGSLILRFEAKDTSALRASINSYLRWISLTQNILEIVNRTCDQQRE
ncbi:MAG: KEOPS complex subunit Pcc1 [Candidatus Bathyarchaeia archaeon]